ncbi:MAG: type II toxin-antitoxin system VapB family antitoxin [Puniceicoccaceae bacterium]|nr:MAG: type II toxin-antitoxin system VapB family antitoxin [Puniceicoccaceae bacterium]
MKTTIDIPDQALRDAMKYTGAKTKREAVVGIIEDFNRRQRMAGLVRHLGTFTSLAENEAIEAVDRAKTARQFGQTASAASRKPQSPKQS